MYVSTIFVKSASSSSVHASCRYLRISIPPHLILSTIYATECRDRISEVKLFTINILFYKTAVMPFCVQSNPTNYHIDQILVPFSLAMSVHIMIRYIGSLTGEIVHLIFAYNLLVDAFLPTRPAGRRHESMLSPLTFAHRISNRP